MIRFFLILSLTCLSSGLKLKIGGLFDTNDPDLKESFRYAIEVANRERLVNSSIRLDSIIYDIPYGNEFAASKKLCKLFNRGTPAVIAPSSPSSSSHCMNVCDAKEMPYIDVNFDPETKVPVINMHPHADGVAQIFADLINASDWKSFTIIYESAPWLPRVARKLKLYDSNKYEITARRINVELNKMNFRHVLQGVKTSGDTRIVLDCSIETLPELLKQAQQVGLLTDYHQFIVTTMDMHTIDLEPYQYSGTTITGIRLVDPESPLMEHLSKLFAEKEPERENADEEAENANEGLQEEEDADEEPEEEENRNEELETGNADEDREKVTVQSALIFDGVLLLAEAFKQFDTDQLRPKKLSCDDNEAWENGNSITNFMRNTVVQGLTGEIRFDNRGHRSNFAVDIVELTSSGIAKVGTWNSTNGLFITEQTFEKSSVVEDGSLRNKTFIVITALTPPYGMLKDTAEKLSGNNRFEGFGIDLIHELSLMLGFNYEFRLQEDKDYGVKNNVTNEWTGMIKELIDERADLAITDLTITAERESGVDFTLPFMNLGISILYQKETKEPPSTFSFLSPFSTEVWMYLGGAYFGVSLCLYILGRISPSEWDNPYPCIEEPTELENQFSFSNALWFATGALLQQGSEIAPKAPSTRAVATTWWFFTLIMVSSYTANLAAFLTVDVLTSPLKDVEDLYNCFNPEFSCPAEFGAKKSGSTINFFKEALNGTLFANMYTYMKNNPNKLTDDNEEGLERAKTLNYAYLMESSSIEYYIERNCELRQLGGLLDEKGYGIAMRKNSDYRSALSQGVLALQEQGKLTAMKNKWWKEKTKGTVCDAKAGGGDDQDLTMANMFGVFFVLLVGSGFASIYAIAEWLLIIYFRAKRENVPFKQDLMDEFRFIIKCSGNTKTMKHRKSTSMESYESHGSNSLKHTKV